MISYKYHLPTEDGGRETIQMKLMTRQDWWFAQIRNLCFDSFTGMQRPPEGILRHQYDTAGVFIATPFGRPDELTGFAIVTQKNGQPYVWSIAVKESYRGQGIGSYLLKEIITEYPEADYIELICRVDNPAQKLYFDMGWRPYNIAKRFYGDEGDGLVMRRKLCRM